MTGPLPGRYDGNPAQNAEQAYANIDAQLDEVIRDVAMSLRTGQMPTDVAVFWAKRGTLTPQNALASLNAAALVRLARAWNTANGYAEPELPPLDPVDPDAPPSIDERVTGFMADLTAATLRHGLAAGIAFNDEFEAEIVLRDVVKWPAEPMAQRQRVAGSVLFDVETAHYSWEKWEI